MQSHRDSGVYCLLPKRVTDPALRGTAKAPQALPRAVTQKIPADPRERVLSGESGDTGTWPEMEKSPRDLQNAAKQSAVAVMLALLGIMGCTAGLQLCLLLQSFYKSINCQCKWCTRLQLEQTGSSGYKELNFQTKLATWSLTDGLLLKNNIEKQYYGHRSIPGHENIRLQSLILGDIQKKSQVLFISARFIQLPFLNYLIPPKDNPSKIWNSHHRHKISSFFELPPHLSSNTPSYGLLSIPPICKDFTFFLI